MKHTHKTKDGVTRTSLSRGWTNPRAPEWYAVPAPLSSTIIKPNFAINSLINILKTRWTFVYVFWKIFPTMQSCWFHPLYRYKIVCVGFHISVCSSFCLHYFCQDFLSSCRKCIMQVWCTSDFFFFFFINHRLSNFVFITWKTLNISLKHFSIQHCVITIVCDSRQVGGFLRYSGFLHQ